MSYRCGRTGDWSHVCTCPQHSKDRPYASGLDKVRARVLSVYADTDALNGWMRDRDVVTTAYDPNLRADLPVNAAIGWARENGYLETNPESGSRRITDAGRKFVARDELGVLLMGEADAG